jgi:flagellar basal-body rod protein FlgB
MLERMTARLDSHGSALVLRAQRQQLIASNIANADTPGYVARDFDFAAALKKVNGGPASSSMSLTSEGHMRTGNADPRRPDQVYALNAQPAMDSNTVDLDRERASFVDNAVQYETTLRFINGHVKTMLSAITGQ